MDHSERSMDFDNCTLVEIYVKDGFLRSLMIVQALCSLLGLLSTALTARRVYRTVLIDVPFREYLLVCYGLQVVQTLSLGFLQLLLLGRFLLLSPCEVQISGTLCYMLRFTSNLPIFALPFVNAALTLYRLLVFIFQLDSLRKELRILRLCELLAVLVFVADSTYRYWDVVFPDKVAYCTGNMVSLAGKLNLQSYTSLAIEVITNVIGLWLFRKHKRDLCCEHRRSYDVNVVLMRRQIMYTYILFLPYSILHALCFGLFNLISLVYRSNFGGLPEPQYSAGSGYTYLPCYFSVISPWILYYTVRKAESKRVSTTKILISEEKNAQNVFFDTVAKQWGDQPLSTPQRKRSKKPPFGSMKTRIHSKEETQSNHSILVAQ